MKRSKEYLMEEWVSPYAFPFILPLVEKFENSELNIIQVYKEIDKTSERLGYNNLPLYERFNFAYFLRNDKFPENMVTIQHEAEQGKMYKDGICMISQPKYNNTIIYRNGEFELRSVYQW